jgi:hypothetical protein
MRVENAEFRIKQQTPNHKQKTPNKEQKTPNKEQRTKKQRTKKQRTKNKEQRTKNKEQKTKDPEQRTKNKEQRTKKLGTTNPLIEIQNILKIGENETSEFKTNFSDEVIVSLVAFSNAKGGKVYIGVDDNATIKGVQLGKESVAK